MSKTNKHEDAAMEALKELVAVRPHGEPIDYADARFMFFRGAQYGVSLIQKNQDEVFREMTDEKASSSI